MTHPEPFTLAIIGCGAVVQELHTRVLDAVAPPIEVRLCVDIDRERAEHVSNRVGGTAVQGGLEELLALEPTDGVLVALPNELHAATSITCLLRGRHVLCEKPLATSEAEREQLARALEDTDRILSVNLLRRFLPATIALRQLVEDNALGALEHADVCEGGAGWPSRTGFQFLSSSSRGGVTLDRGPHIFDLLLALLGKPTVDAYLDDADGGVEATSITSLRWPNGCNGCVRISKLEPWPARARLTAKDGTVALWDLREPIAIRILDPLGVELERRSGPHVAEASLPPFLEALRALLGSWVGACRGANPNPTPFSEVRAGCQLIERCYAARRPLDLEWQRFGA